MTVSSVFRGQNKPPKKNLKCVLVNHNYEIKNLNDDVTIMRLQGKMMS